MSDEAQVWLRYAEENLSIARLALEAGYYNSCLQNIQQAVEKYLKSVLLCRGQIFPRTHSIGALNGQLKSLGVETTLSDEDCELLDSIYIPTKYPVGSALPDFNPDDQISAHCLVIGQKLQMVVLELHHNNE